MKFKLQLSESIFDEVDTNATAPAGPTPGPDTGVASMLISAINDEWSTIDMYNSLISTLTNEHMEDMIPVIQDINNEENKHVGQLQKLLEQISANTKSIETGADEAAEQLSDTASPVNALVDFPDTSDDLETNIVVDDDITGFSI